MNLNILPVKKIMNSNNLFDSTEEESSKNGASLIDNNEVVMSHLSLMDILLDLDVAVENKSLFSTMLNRFFRDCDTEFMQNSKTVEIFSLSSVNRVYVKSCKLSLVLVTLFKYILLEFPNFDVTLKNQMKRIISSHNEILAVLFEVFGFENVNPEITQQKGSTIDKIKKIIKSINFPLIKQKKQE